MPSPSRSSPVLSISPATAAQGQLAASPPQPWPRWVQRLLSLGLLLIILASVAIAVLLAAAHARDRYWINIASGSWIALALQADHGVLYPPLRDEQGNFGGTRYMPLHILAHAGLARFTGEYLLSGRIIGFTGALMWMMAIIALARQRGCPWLVAGALAASVLASPTGVQALCTIRSDGLALALQLWALWIIGRSDKPTSAILAAILCAMGFLAKLTAVWVPLAIVIWLLWRNRTSLLSFIVTGVVIAGGALALLNLMTDGRMLENLLQSGASGWRGWGSVITWSQRRILQFISEWSPTTWVLASPAALALLLAVARRDLKPVHLAWLTCCGTMVIMFADAGVGENHILEIAAITAVCAGDLWRRAARSIGDDAHAATSNAGGWSVAQMLLATLIGWSSQATIKHSLWRDIDGAITVVRSGQPAAEDDPRPLESTLAGKRFLSDDPTLAALHGQKPVINDAFMFRGFERSHPEWVDEMIARIERREFDVIVLSRTADPESWWFRELFLGPRVTSSIAENYQLDRREAGFEIYLPRR